MPARPSDKYIPLYFVAFFLVIFAVNGVFVYYATKTHTGVVTRHAYEKGLNYNKTIELANAQDELGIESRILIENGQIIFRSNRHVKANVTAYITRPTQDGYDFKVKLSGEKGYFTGKIDFPMKGQWHIAVVANSEEYKQYQTSINVVIN